MSRVTFERGDFVEYIDAEQHFPRDDVRFHNGVIVDFIESYMDGEPGAIVYRRNGSTFDVKVSSLKHVPLPEKPFKARNIYSVTIESTPKPIINWM